MTLRVISSGGGFPVCRDKLPAGASWIGSYGNALSDWWHLLPRSAWHEELPGIWHAWAGYAEKGIEFRTEPSVMVMDSTLMIKTSRHAAAGALTG